MEIIKTEITNVQVFVLNEHFGKLKAFARVLLNDELQLTGLKLYEGSKGLFLSYPSDPGCNGTTKNFIMPNSESFGKALQDAVISKYEEQVKINFTIWQEEMNRIANTRPNAPMFEVYCDYCGITHLTQAEELADKCPICKHKDCLNHC
jgi:stage V sporulation protein G